MLDVDILVDEAVAAFNQKETVEVTEVIEVPAPTPTPKPDQPAAEEAPADQSEKKEEGAEAAADPPAVSHDPSVTFQEGGAPGTDAVAPSPGPTIKTITKQIPSPKAVLGKAVEQALGKGKSIPVSILVDIAVLGIREIPEGTGWILDNFPKSLKQAKALEKALSGFTGFESRASFLSTPAGTPSRMTPGGTPRNTPSPSKAGKNGKKGKKNQLVDEPECDKPTPVSHVHRTIT